MLGVFPVCVWSRPLEDGWEARVEARTRDGAIVGAAESECRRSERRWAKADDYAIRSMAQTRATSKALRLTLGFVMELAGFDATPADEIPAETVPKPETPPDDRSKIPAEQQPSAEQKAELAAALRTLAEIDPATDWAVRCREIVGAPWGMATTAMVGMLIEKLQAELRHLDDEGRRARGERLLTAAERLVGLRLARCSAQRRLAWGTAGRGRRSGARHRIFLHPFAFRIGAMRVHTRGSIFPYRSPTTAR